MLVQHVREHFNGQEIPVATLVAIDPTNIGVAINTGYRDGRRIPYNKRIMTEIALGRAERNPYHLGNTPVPDVVVLTSDDWTTVKELIDIEVQRLQERAKQYFKTGT